MSLKKPTDAPAADFIRSHHIKFFKRCLQVLPGQYASLDTSRMTILFFAVSGLDVLDALDEIEVDRTAIIDWIYMLQALPNPRGPDGDGVASGGFRGSTSCDAFDSAHVAMTYTALATLAILGDDLRRVDSSAVIAGLRRLQMPDGGFCSTTDGGEDDMRFLYCAACVSHMLGDWSGVNIDRAASFITSAQTYEGGFAQRPFGEAHGGSTFCAVAALTLMGRLQSALSSAQRERLIRWCAARQNDTGDCAGFQGRPNKPTDTCYSFWVGASLVLLGAFDRTVNCSANRAFLMTTQSRLTGGFSKWADHSPDALHAYLGIAGLSLMGERGLMPLNAALNVSTRASARLPPPPLNSCEGRSS